MKNQSSYRFEGSSCPKTQSELLNLGFDSKQMLAHFRMAHDLLWALGFNKLLSSSFLLIIKRPTRTSKLCKRNLASNWQNETSSSRNSYRGRTLDWLDNFPVLCCPSVSDL